MSRAKDILVLSIIIATCLISSCENEFEFPGDCLEVKIIDENCGMTALQIVGLNTAGVDLATYTLDGKVYNSVFATRFHCRHESLLPQDGSTFHIKLTDEESWKELNEKSEITCAWCLRGYARLEKLPFTFVELVEQCGAGIDE